MLKTKKFRRLLAALLSVLMLSISLPLAAFAADGEQTDAEKAGTTPKTSVAFLFTDNATFSQTVVSDRVYELNGTYTAADISVPVPEYFELDVADDWNFTVSDPEPTVTVPVKRTPQKTEVAFLFTDNATFSQTVVSDRIYDLNGTYTAADISVPVPECFELDVADDWNFTVSDPEPTITVPVKRTPQKTQVAFLFTDNATFSQTVVSDRIYELNGTYTAADISVPVPEYFELDVADDWTFTVSDPEPTVTVPVKKIVTETQVAFLFTDNATFSQTVLSNGLYRIGETYTADQIDVAVPEYFELDVAADWSFTVETAEPTIMVPVKRSAPKTEVAFLFTDNATFSQTVISERIYEIGGEFTAEDISVDVPDGWELDLPEGWSFKVETSEPTVTVPVKAAAKTPEEPTNPEEPATPTDPTDPGEPEQPAKPADENTTTVTSDSGKDTAKAEQVVKSDTAPAASATKVLPQTGVETAAPVLGFVVVLVAALGGAGCYLFVVRKKLN